MLILGVGQKERFYVSLKHKGVFLKTIDPGESVKFSSRNPGVVVIQQDAVAVQDPADGAPPTVASGVVESIAAHPVEVVVTALFKLGNGHTDGIATDTVKSVKGARRDGSLFGADVHIVALNPKVPKTNEERAAEDAEAAVQADKLREARLAEDVKASEAAREAELKNSEALTAEGKATEEAAAASNIPVETVAVEEPKSYPGKKKWWAAHRNDPAPEPVAAEEPPPPPDWPDSLK